MARLAIVLDPQLARGCPDVHPRLIAKILRPNNQDVLLAVSVHVFRLPALQPHTLCHHPPPDDDPSPYYPTTAAGRVPRRCSGANVFSNRVTIQWRLGAAQTKRFWFFGVRNAGEEDDGPPPRREEGGAEPWQSRARRQMSSTSRPPSGQGKARAPSSPGLILRASKKEPRLLIQTTRYIPPPALWA
eukprot:6753476-Pyramimonas_sp.AAC.1